jgi:antibiotic biosynthesis monooxygenase (ABM) superfamily enzyme
MITRMWRGWTSSGNADAYQHFLLETLFPAMRGIPGFLGAEALRREEEGGTAFVTLTRFGMLSDVSAFAGADYERAVLEPEALALLSRYDNRAVHFETVPFQV